MKGFVRDIEDLAVKNGEFRRVLYTAQHCQLVVMALKPKEEIGTEVHTLDQFFRVEAGTGEAILDGVRTAIRAGFAVVVPAGANHNIVNTGSVPLKLYTLYAPPNHRDGVVHHTRVDAEADNEHFDGKTTEQPVDWKKAKGIVILILVIVVLVLLFGGGGGQYYGRGAGWGGPQYGGGLLGLVLIILLILWLTGNIGGGMMIRQAFGREHSTESRLFLRRDTR